MPSSDSLHSSLTCPHCHKEIDLIASKKETSQADLAPEIPIAPTVNEAYQTIIIPKTNLEKETQAATKPMHQTLVESEQAELNPAEPPKKTKGNEALRKIIARRMSSGDFEVPPMPGVAEQVLGLSDDAGTVELAKAIIQDQAITTKIIRISNSAYYGGVYEFKTLPTAITRIGIAQVRLLILGCSLLSKEFVGGKYRDECKRLGEHALACAYLAAIVSELCGFSPKEDAFLGGLLHDIGKLVIYTALSDVSRRESGEWTEEAIDDVLEQYHPNAGGIVAKSWKLQSWLEEVIRFHHEHEKATERPRVVAIVSLANLFCHRFGLGVPEDKTIFISDKLKEDARFSEKNVSTLESRVDGVRDIIEKLGAF